MDEAVDWLLSGEADEQGRVDGGGSPHSGGDAAPESIRAEKESTPKPQQPRSVRAAAVASRSPSHVKHAAPVLWPFLGPPPDGGPKAATGGGNDLSDLWEALGRRSARGSGGARTRGGRHTQPVISVEPGQQRSGNGTSSHTKTKEKQKVEARSKKSLAASTPTSAAAEPKPAMATKVQVKARADAKRSKQGNVPKDMVAPSDDPAPSISGRKVYYGIAASTPEGGLDPNVADFVPPNAAHRRSCDEKQPHRTAPNRKTSATSLRTASEKPKRTSTRENKGSKPGPSTATTPSMDLWSFMQPEHDGEHDGFRDKPGGDDGGAMVSSAGASHWRVGSLVTAGA